MIRISLHSAAGYLVRSLLILGPSVLALVFIVPTRAADGPSPSDIAITELLEATGSECYVYASTTFDPLWLGEQVSNAQNGDGRPQWVVPGHVWRGASADAAAAFEGSIVSEGSDSVWILSQASGRRNAIQLRRISGAGTSVWIDADVIEPVGCDEHGY